MLELKAVDIVRVAGRGNLYIIDPGLANAPDEIKAKIKVGTEVDINHIGGNTLGKIRGIERRTSDPSCNGHWHIAILLQG